MNERYDPADCKIFINGKEVEPVEMRHICPWGPLGHAQSECPVAQVVFVGTESNYALHRFDTKAEAHNYWSGLIEPSSWGEVPISDDRLKSAIDHRKVPA